MAVTGRAVPAATRRDGRAPLCWRSAGAARVPAAEPEAPPPRGHLLGEPARREPAQTVLYQLLTEHLATFLARLDGEEDHARLPRFVERELRDFLDCGILAKGFCRVHCPTCTADELVAFS